MIRYETAVVGTSFEGRQDMLARLTGQELCFLIAEEDNPYDRYAIAVCVVKNDMTLKIGYIGKHINQELRSLMSEVTYPVYSWGIVGGHTLPNGTRAAYGARINLEVSDSFIGEEDLPF